VRILIFPLLVLGALAGYVAGVGFAARWHSPFPLEYVVAGALHLAWIVSATRRSGGFDLTTICWAASG
jgi:hypothetical protein